MRFDLDQRELDAIAEAVAARVLSELAESLPAFGSREIEPRLLSAEVAAKYLDVCDRTLGKLDIPHIKAGERGLRKYDRKDLNDWIERAKKNGKGAC